MNGSDKPREGLQLSAELLNAFVDDQLDSEEKSRIFVEVNNDERLSREVCELRKVRDLVQLAYRDIPGAPKPRTAPSRRVPLGIAAGLALMMGATLGWFLHNKTPANAPLSAATAGEPLKVLMHVADDNPMHLAQALDDIEASLEHFRTTGTNARLEVIINGNGLALVREDATLFADRIDGLQKKYDNLAFMACQNTIDRLKRDAGITAKLLPGVVVIDSGVAQLMRRQNQGWAYIQA
jgi:intracellular sulfur oxidation DsrE/DsrF family protein